MYRKSDHRKIPVLENATTPLETALDSEDRLYGSTMDGRIWRFDPDVRPRPLSYIEGLDLSRATFSQSAQETLKGDFQHNWRVIEWNPATNSFFGILWETTALFEFFPDQDYIRALADFRHEAYQGMPRNPEISQLGFLLAPDQNTLLYLAHGPAAEIEGKPAVQSSLYLLSYDIEKRRMKNHGLVIGTDNRRPFFAESLVIGSDDHLYSVAWVEVTDPSRRATIAKARAFGPEETERMLYEVQLLRLPAWKTFPRQEGPLNCNRYYSTAQTMTDQPAPTRSPVASPYHVRHLRNEAEDFEFHPL